MFLFLLSVASSLFSSFYDKYTNHTELSLQLHWMSCWFSLLALILYPCSEGRCSSMSSPGYSYFYEFFAFFTDIRKVLWTKLNSWHYTLNLHSNCTLSNSCPCADLLSMSLPHALELLSTFILLHLLNIESIFTLGMLAIPASLPIRFFLNVSV